MKFDDTTWALSLNTVPDETAQQRASRVLNSIIKGFKAERVRAEAAAKAGQLLVRTVGQG